MQRFNVCEKVVRSDIEVKKDKWQLDNKNSAIIAEKRRALLCQTNMRIPAGGGGGTCL